MSLATKFTTILLTKMAAVRALENFIDGKLAPCSRHIDSFNPSTGEVHLKVPDSGEEEVMAAVEAAKRAFESWSQTPVAERSKIMLKIANLIEERLEDFAQAESQDQGKPVWLARLIDIPRACLNFRFFATSILHNVDISEQLPDRGALNYIQRMPVGVAGLISPWNLPLYLLTFKIAPCIAYGNTCICKPSELTSLTAYMLCKVLTQAGLPPGVVNMIFGVGPRAGEAMVVHPDVPLISFTGSTAVGKRIMRVGSEHVKKLSLELGGKNAGIVFDDANLEECLPTTIKSAFVNQGEVCLTTSRVYVQEKLFDTFVERYVALARQWKVGDPSDPSVKMGALISKEHLAKVKGYVELARQEGASILCGDGVDTLELPERNKKGYFMLPTVITGVKDDSKLMVEEIFGPVVCIVPFKTEEEVIRRANSVVYGLAASVWSQDVGKLTRVARALRVGTVWSNCWMLRSLNIPFGGMKLSGLGREGAEGSKSFYTEQKTICIKYT